MTKRGRPTLGDRPMTSSERNRRRMDRLREAAAEREQLFRALQAAHQDLAEYKRRFGRLD